jgi:hypothetical protein
MQSSELSPRDDNVNCGLSAADKFKGRGERLRKPGANLLLQQP